MGSVTIKRTSLENALSPMPFCVSGPEVLWIRLRFTHLVLSVVDCSSPPLKLRLRGRGKAEGCKG